MCVCVCVCVQARQGPGSRCGWLEWAAKQPGAPSWALWEPRAAVTRSSGLAALQIPPSGGSASCVCAWRLEPGRRGAGGQGLSSRGIPVGTSKIRVIRLPSSQTGLFSAASCLLKILFTQKLGVPKPLSFKHTHTHTLNLYKTFLTLQHLPRKQKKNSERINYV